jgi:hypothetical protein
MKIKTLTTITVITIAFGFALVAQQQRNSQAAQPEAAKADPAIVAKLSEIVTIRERAFANYEVLLAAGRAPFEGSAAIDLAEARIELARERGQNDAIVTALKELVVAHERRLKRAQDAMKDRLPPGEVDKAKAALLEAEVRLLRAQR